MAWTKPKNCFHFRLGHPGPIRTIAGPAAAFNWSQNSLDAERPLARFRTRFPRTTVDPANVPRSGSMNVHGARKTN